MGAEPALGTVVGEWQAVQDCAPGPRLASALPAAPVDGSPTARAVRDHGIAFPVLARVVAIIDAALMLAAVVAVAMASGATLPVGHGVVAFALTTHLASTVLRGLSAYRLDRLARLWPALRIAVASAVCAAAGLAVLVGLLGDRGGVWIALSGAAGFLLLAASRLVLVVLLALWRATGQLARNVAVIGANDYSRSFIDAVRHDPQCGLSIVGVYDDRLNRIPKDAKDPPLGTVATLVSDARHRRIDVIVVALPLSATERIAQIRGQLAPTVTDIFLTADAAGLRYDGRDFEALGRNGVIRVASRPLSDWDQAVKASFDRVVALLALVGLSPLLLAVALLIRLDSRGPILFRQPRTGFNNRAFTVLKFRTMYADMADLMADRQTTRDDPRVTRLGKFLRRSSIDELPQLLNVLRGEMSLVGPRPHAPHTKAANRYFDDVVADYALRHRIKPGITGWAQVNGWRGETLHIAQIEHRVTFDLAYIENWSMLMDIKILFMTVFKGFGGANAY